MDENLIAFKTCCRDAFQYLARNHGFRELSDPHPKHSNAFQVRFSNGTVELLILGEGYGTMASVHYVTQDGTEVAQQMLEPDWDLRRKPKSRGAEKSQRDQIVAAAERINARDQDILTGDLSRLNAAAARWRAICEKMKWK